MYLAAGGEHYEQSVQRQVQRFFRSLTDERSEALDGRRNHLRDYCLVLELCCVALRCVWAKSVHELLDLPL
jgi:hypothetical protein